MNKNHIYVLIHSPLVGSLTWKLIAEEMRQRGLDVLVPILKDTTDSEEPFWKQHARSFSTALAKIPKDSPVTLVAHSGAGPFLPALRQSLVNPVYAYVFVDAGLPRNGATRLDLMKSEDPEWAAQFQKDLEQGERFPNWSFEDLQEVIPAESLRRQMAAEIRPRGLSFFTEPIPVFDGWPDAPCVYIRFSAPYQGSAIQARQAGWPTYELEAGHFHMLVDTKAVTDLIVRSVHKVSS
ncbi:MAG TPA: alpha/beta fold hydrolase [Anaerolineales bacterium]|nr:alpha/beta fold hydrolase [Anaerolineales bacterium]